MTNHAQQTDASGVDNQLTRIADVTKHARTAWFLLLGFLAFAGVTLLGVEDADFFSYGASTDMPILGISIPTTSFFYVAPFLIAAFYIHLHLYLLKLWKAVAGLPKEIDGEPVEDRVPPWLVTDWALSLRNLRKGRPLRRVSNFITLVLVWIGPHFVLTAFWWRVVPIRDKWLIGWTGAIASIAIILTALAWAAARRDLVNRPDSTTRLWTLIRGTYRWAVRSCFIALIVLTPIVFAGISYDRLENKGKITRLGPASANLHGAELSIKPDDWQPYAVAKADFEAEYRRRLGISGRDAWEENEEEAFNEEWKRRRSEYISKVRAPSLQGRDLRYADMTQAFLANVKGTLPVLLLMQRQEMERDEIIALLKQKSVRAERAALNQAVLEGAELITAHLEEAEFVGAHLEGASLIGALLEGAHLNTAHLKSADLRWAHVTGADLTGARLEAADLKWAHLKRADFSRAHLEGADLHEAHLEGAILSRAHLKGALLRMAHLNGADLTRAKMLGANLYAAQLEGADLTHANLEGATLFAARLNGARLTRAHLKGAGFHTARLEGADLSRAHLEATRFDGASLERATLVRARLDGAILGAANLKGANLWDAHLSGALLIEADLSEAKRLTQEQLTWAIGDERTVLPEGVTIPLCWPELPEWPTLPEGVERPEWWDTGVFGRFNLVCPPEDDADPSDPAIEESDADE